MKRNKTHALSDIKDIKEKKGCDFCLDSIKNALGIAISCPYEKCMYDELDDCENYKDKMKELEKGV